MSSSVIVRSYLNTVAKNKTRIYCQVCKKPLLCKDYEGHLLTEHPRKFGRKDACVWCLGTVSWNKGQKALNVPHLKQCYKIYWKSHKFDDLVQQDTLNNYRSLIRKNGNQIYCEMCHESMLCKQFQKHLLEKHADRYVTEHSCQWCLGKYSWNVKEKSQHVNHLKGCYGLYWRNHLLKNIPLQDDIVFSVARVCRAKDLFGRVKVQRCKAFYDDTIFLEKPDMAWWNEVQSTNKLTFWDENDDLAIQYIRKYGLLQESARWYHLMVKVSTFPSFLENMANYGSNAFLLPFSCLCDGGDEQHRHMICVARNGAHFMKNCWKKMKAAPGKEKNFQSRKAILVKSSNHLKNVIGYVCKRQSRCNFLKEGIDLNHSHHFYIMRSVTKYYYWIASLSFAGGLASLLNSKFGNKSTDSYIDYCSKDPESRRFRVQMKHLFPFMNVVMPVARTWMPVSDERTEAYLCLPNDRKLYFKECVACDASEHWWIQQQASRGNCFIRAVADEFWYPIPKLQHTISGIMSGKAQLNFENMHLKAENMHLSNSMSDLQAENVSLKAKNLNILISNLKAENMKLKAENVNLTVENVNLKTENVNLTAHNVELTADSVNLNILISNLKADNADLKQENADLKSHNMQTMKLFNLEPLSDFKLEMSDLKRENTDLKLEMSDLKRENVNLKRENVDLKLKMEEMEARMKLEIDSLKQENVELKSRLDRFESNMEIISLRSENNSLKLENACLKRCLKRLQCK